MAAPNTQDLARSRGLKKLARQLLLVIQLVAGVMGLVYTGLTLLDAPLDRLAQAFDTSSLIKFGLFLFFFGWVWGASDDTIILRDVFEIDPQNGNIGVPEIGGIVAFLLVFVALFSASNYPVTFQAILLTFICTNVGTWAIIVRRTKPIFSDNADLYLKRSDNVNYIKLVIVSDYLNGNWQRRRFIVLVALAAIQVVLAWLVSAGVMGKMLNGLTVKGVPGSVLTAYLPAIMFVIYVVISELWMKIYRIKVKSDMVTLDYVDQHYKIARQAKTIIPPLNLRSANDFSEIFNENYS